MLKSNVYDVCLDIFENIEKKSNIEDVIYSFENNNGCKYLKTNVSRTVAFKVHSIDGITPCMSDR